MSDKVEQLCMAGAPPEAVLCALMDESNQLRSELQEAKDAIKLLREALETSSSVFGHYVLLHRDKNPPDGEKAARNAFHQVVCQEALEKTEKWK